MVLPRSNALSCIGEAGSARNSTRPRGTASAPWTLPDAATSGGSRTSRNSTSGLPTSAWASCGLMAGTAAWASASIDWTVFMVFPLPPSPRAQRRTTDLVAAAFERLDDVLAHHLGVGEQHHGVVAEEQ